MNKHEFEPTDHAQTWCSDCKEPCHPDELSENNLCSMCENEPEL